jgi:predicted RNA-binding Zn ribbon-like protein
MAGQGLIVRRGGFEIAGRYFFELTGGAPCLDFANTLDERRGTPKDLLSGYMRLLQWCEQTEVLAAADISALGQGANGREAHAALADAKELRETLFSIFRTLSDGEIVGEALLEEFNAWVRRANARRRIAPHGGGFVWTHDAGQDNAPDRMLWPIVESAASVLTSEDLRSRVRLCSGPRCAWAFLDFSRRRNRKWCDMSVCGNRTKARRFYQARTRPADEG